MKRLAVAGVIAGAGLFGLFTTPHAGAAGFPHAGLELPELVEAIQCRVIRERVVHPGGRVVYRTVRRCGPRIGPRCRTVRERIVRPGGRVVYRTVRRCR